MLIAVALAAMTPSQPPAHDYLAKPVPAASVRLTDRFWAPRIDLAKATSIDQQLAECESTRRIENYLTARGQGQFKDHDGLYFNDSDLYKLIEGVARLLALKPDADRQASTQKLINTIISAQEPDGYLYTAKQVYANGGKSSAKPERWVYVQHEHELYCAGHMYESAVAWFETTGDRTYLNAAIKNADLVCSVFNDQGLKNPPGHQEIEVGLVKLWKATGNEKYLKQAKWFLDQRGKREGRSEPNYGEYAQDHKPAVEQDEAVGHAVRAAYMYMAMADIAAYTGDQAYAKALDNLWKSVAETKVYITGGIGATGSGEAFGKPYELPNLTAYQETCATIANAMWNQRMFQLTGDGKYIDVMEKALYNGFLSGYGLDGKSYFYPNPLMSQGANRPSWFYCACCPPNVLRVIPTVPSWLYATGENKLFVNLYAQNTADLKIGQRTVNLDQKTEYPWKGDVELTVNPDQDATFDLALRIPGWADGKPYPSDLYTYADPKPATVKITVNGQTVTTKAEKGYVTIRRNWKKGDKVSLVLPMEPKFVQAHENVEDDRGRLAVTMGPIVYCAEFPDQPSKRVFQLVIDPKSRLTARHDANLLKGVNVITAQGRSAARTLDGKFQLADKVEPITLVPYHVWANRGSGQMAVWLPTQAERAWPEPAPTIAATSKVTNSNNSDSRAMVDQLLPKNSDDHSQPFFHWWPKQDTDEWVQFDFATPKTVKSVQVYWFDDRPRGGGCRIPANWKVQLKINGQWVDAKNPSGYPVAQDQFCKTNFDPTQAEALRIQVRLQKDYAAGIHEIVIE